MTITALTLALTLSAAGGTTVTENATEAPIRKAAAAAEIPPSMEQWMADVPEKRPAALPMLYATYGALQFADVASTRRALAAGAVEANPLMKQASRSSGTMFAVKAVTAAASIYFVEKAWKKNRRGAVIMMAVMNGVTAAVVAKNLRNAR